MINASIANKSWFGKLGKLFQVRCKNYFYYAFRIVKIFILPNFTFI